MELQETAQIRQVESYVTKEFNELKSKNEKLDLMDFGTLTTLDVIADILKLPISKEISNLVSQELKQ